MYTICQHAPHQFLQHLSARSTATRLALLQGVPPARPFQLLPLSRAPSSPSLVHDARSPRPSAVPRVVPDTSTSPTLTLIAFGGPRISSFATPCLACAFLTAVLCPSLVPLHREVTHRTNFVPSMLLFVLHQHFLDLHRLLRHCVLRCRCRSRRVGISSTRLFNCSGREKTLLLGGSGVVSDFVQPQQHLLSDFRGTSLHIADMRHRSGNLRMTSEFCNHFRPLFFPLSDREIHMIHILRSRRDCEHPLQCSSAVAGMKPAPHASTPSRTVTLRTIVAASGPVHLAIMTSTSLASR